METMTKAPAAPVDRELGEGTKEKEIAQKAHELYVKAESIYFRAKVATGRIRPLTVKPASTQNVTLNSGATVSTTVSDRR